MVNLLNYRLYKPQKVKGYLLSPEVRVLEGPGVYVLGL